MAEDTQDRANFQWATALPYFKRIDTLEAEIQDIMDKAKEQCAVLRDDIKVVKTEAHDAGFRRAAFNSVMADIKRIRKVHATRNKLSQTNRDDYDQLCHLLGMDSLPLFDFANIE